MSKRITTTTLAVAAVVAALSTGAFAKGFGPGLASLTDTDGDGVISAEEIRTQVETQRAEDIAQYDTDGDGTLSDDERDAAREAMRAERLATADTDGDGELSRSERRAARETGRDAIEAQLDVDGDGVVSDAEGAGFDEFREEMREEGGRRHGRGGERADPAI